MAVAGQSAGGPDTAAHGRPVWRPLVLASLAVVLTGFADHQIRIEVREHGGAGARTTGAAISRWSPRLALGTGAGLLGAGLATRTPGLTSTGRDALVAMGVAGAVTVAAKVTVGRARPFAGRGTHYFVPFRFATRYNSFPSGHTSQAFAFAAAIAGHTRHRALRIGVYGAAGVVGIARVAADRHFASDVVAGAILGTVVGRGTVHHFATHPSRAALEPLVTPHGLGVAVRWTF